MKLPSVEGHNKSLMISQPWCRFDAWWYQTIALANVDHETCRQMASLGHSEISSNYEQKDAHVNMSFVSNYSLICFSAWQMTNWK